MTKKKKHHKRRNADADPVFDRRRGHYGGVAGVSYQGHGWVAPLSPDQFAGSPQADTGGELTTATGGDFGGDGGGDGGSV